MGRHKKVVNLEETQLSGFDAERANSAVCKRLDELEDNVKNMAEQLFRINEVELRVAKLENPEIPKISIETPKEIPTTTVSEQHYPVPTDYIDLVKTLLNSKFGIKIEPFSDRPQFAFTIVVPKEYSSLPPVEWATAKGDFRTRILSYADGINGVREWVTKVFDSFNPEVKAKIKSEI